MASAHGCTCGKASPPETNAVVPKEADAAAPAIASPGGLSAPIAASHVGEGHVVVAGLDVPARAIRVQKLRGAGDVVAERTILDELKWTSDAELRMSAAGGGVVVTWRGLRNGKAVQQMVLLGKDLAPKGSPVDVTATSCATRDMVWFAVGRVVKGIRLGSSDGGTVTGYSGTLPIEHETSITCGASAAFALLESEEMTSAVALGAAETAVPLLKESELGEESQERADWVEGDTLGIVRLDTRGGLSMRELRAGTTTQLRRLEKRIPQDDDIVAVDASPRAVAIVYSSDASDACSAGSPSTKISAIRVDRNGRGESVHELSPGECGREVGPFFTSAFGDDVVVAWVERGSTEAKTKPPITGLGYARIAAGGKGAKGRVSQRADALVDAGCDKTRCYAVALTRRNDDPMLPGIAKVLTYP